MRNPPGESRSMRGRTCIAVDRPAIPRDDTRVCSIPRADTPTRRPHGDTQASPRAPVDRTERRSRRRRSGDLPPLLQRALDAAFRRTFARAARRSSPANGSRRWALAESNNNDFQNRNSDSNRHSNSNKNRGPRSSRWTSCPRRCSSRQPEKSLPFPRERRRAGAARRCSSIPLRIRAEWDDSH